MCQCNAEGDCDVVKASDNIVALNDIMLKPTSQECSRPKELHALTSWLPNSEGVALAVIAMQVES